MLMLWQERICGSKGILGRGPNTHAHTKNSAYRAFIVFSVSRKTLRAHAQEKRVNGDLPRLSGPLFHGGIR